MKKLKENAPIKVVAFLLALVLGIAAVWSTTLTLYYWEDLWNAQGYFDSSPCYNALARRQDQVNRLLDMEQNAKWSGTSTYLQRQDMARHRASLAPDKTNFRFALRNADDGALVDGNLKGNALQGQVVSVDTNTIELHEGLPEDAPEDVTPRTASFVIEYGVTPQLTAKDEFLAGQQDYAETRQWLPAVSAGALISDGLLLLLLLFLCSAAGHRKERDGIVLGPLDKIPTDVFVVLVAGTVFLCVVMGESISYGFTQEPPLRAIVGVTVISLLIGWVVLAALLSLCTRIKAHTLWKSCLLWKLCAAMFRGLKSIFSNWSMTGRTIILFLFYLLGTFLTGITIVFAIPYQLVALFLLCRWVVQWKQVRAGTTAILGGDADYKIPTDKMYPDLKEHALQLNDLASAVQNAVDKQLSSERFKAELITNVSHDLKTPLTSIISYVDLLKKEEIPNEKAQEYIEVLDRKSQRLKKLTEDLVEASKASTGALNVVKERIGVSQLLRQAFGEYEEKLGAKSLTLVPNLPENEVYVSADGRHLWRIIDNLLGNCTKYALEGTRVYVDVLSWDGDAVISVKNVSREALNVQPSELMERFVRGEESRSTEGSGLGLSIARSLTELQGGTFRIDIDGDLFKASVRLPILP
ncbi:MAG: HAMP domain-containing sensor histidine kinase [Oscillospiraceae bacterium]